MSYKEIASVVGVVILFAGIGFYWSTHSSSKVKYREVTVERGDLANTILSTGSVSPENRLEIKPPIAGRAEQVLVDEGTNVKKGQILAWMSSTERAALLDAARAEGPAELKRWEKMYKATPVIAPIDGQIILRNIESGQTFTGTDAILVMSDRLTVKALVDETDIAQIKLKQPATIVLDAYAHDKIAAHVDQIAYEAKTVNNVTTYSVDVLPEETPEFMRSGMTANVAFMVEAHKGVLFIPADAVRMEGRDASVMVYDENHKPVPKKIELGLSDGKRTEVKSGLNEGETILVAVFSTKDRKSGGSNPFSPMGNRPRGGGH